jgi:hypothetical protein
MDITMTAVLRPKVLNATLKSFEKHLFKSFSDHRLIVNIDPVGDSTTDAVLNVIYDFFPKDNVYYRCPNTPHFGVAAQWVWSKVESEFVFHLEDDWRLLEDVSLQDLFDILSTSMDMGSIRLLICKEKYMKGYFKDVKSKHFTINNKLSLNPCLCRGVYLRKLSSMMNPSKNPELQVVHASPTSKFGKFTSSWKHVVYDHKKNPIVENIGKNWRIKRNLIRKRSDFVTWTNTNKEEKNG